MHNLKKLIGIFLFAFLFIVACDGHNSFNYIFCSNCTDPVTKTCATDQSKCLGGCTTGSHSYSSLNEVCSALQNRDKNNACLKNERQQQFNKLACPGDFTEN